MRLRSELTLAQVWLSDVRITPADGEPKVKLEFSTDLTPDIAEALFCRELVYAGAVPRSGVDSMVLEGEERDCEVQILRDKVAMKFVAKSVGHARVSFEGTGPKLKFQVSLDGYAGAAADLAVEMKRDPVGLVLKPAQMELPLSGQADTGTAGPQDEEFMKELGIGGEPETAAEPPASSEPAADEDPGTKGKPRSKRKAS